MTVLSYLLTFMAGSVFGLVSMCIFIVAGREDERCHCYEYGEGVNTGAGGSGTEDREPGGLNDEADDADGGAGSVNVLETQEEPGRETYGEAITAAGAGNQQSGCGKDGSERI